MKTGLTTSQPSRRNGNLAGLPAPLLAPLLVMGAFASTSANAALVINEIDYDQPGTDDAEFIELYNTGAAPVSLDGYRLELINGTNGNSYRSIDLEGHMVDASSFFVICSDNGLVANCDYSFTSNISWFQNGAPDAVALYQASDIMDSVSYEGNMNLITEGTALTIADSNTIIMSLSRVPDGLDNDDNALDFHQTCITPGTANITGTGDCSVPAVNPVPLPAAAWLFASGLIGLGFTRRNAALPTADQA